MATFTGEIEVSSREFLEELDGDEKLELFNMLAKQLSKDEDVRRLEHDIKVNKRALVIGFFRDLAPFEQRKFLVDALYVSNDYDDDALKNALEPVITAR